MCVWRGGGRALSSRSAPGNRGRGWAPGGGGGRGARGVPEGGGRGQGGGRPGVLSGGGEERRAGHREPSAAALCGDAPVDVLSSSGAGLRGASAAAAEARGARRAALRRGRKPGGLSEAGRGGLSLRAPRTSLPRPPCSCRRPQPSAPDAPPALAAAVPRARPKRTPGRRGLYGHRCLGGARAGGCVCVRVSKGCRLGCSGGTLEE